MSPQPFVWKDRDTAARDLLQLVYHGPDAVRSHALLVLISIRSTAIIDDLKAIALSQEWEYWNRVCAIRALREMPQDITFPKLLDLAKRHFATWKKLSRQTGSEFNYKLWHFAHPQAEATGDVNLVEEILLFVDVQQTNRPRFLKLLGQADPLIARDFINRMLMYHMTSELRLALIRQLIAILEAQPQLLDLPSVGELHDDSSTDAQAWLDSHFGEIVELSLIVEPKDVSKLPYNWLALRDAIAEKNPILAQAMIEKDAEIARAREEFRKEPPPYETSQIWRKLEGLYDRAADSNRNAVQSLKRIASHPQNPSIPVRAAAVYFLGKLQDYAGVTTYLCRLLQYNSERWGERNFHSPIRVQAGAALKDMVTAEVWEAMVNTFFLRPDPDLQYYLEDWLVYLTDTLSGISTPYHGAGDGRRPWLSALADMDDNLEDLGIS